MPVTIPAPPSTASSENTATENNPATSNAAKQVTHEAGEVLVAAAKVCWVEVKRYPYQPDHQVELLNLQAEADALIIKLQATGQKRLSKASH